jgi:hypothetical protein
VGLGDPWFISLLKLELVLVMLVLELMVVLIAMVIPGLALV